ncbi:MAG: MFS transporter [Chloroflexi bacterium]|nr:MFS transporter [Chloroflexota bacterium]
MASEVGTSVPGPVAQERGILRAFASLSSPDFRCLWVGQLGSSGAEWMDQVTRGWLVYQLTDSAFLLGVATALRSLPLLLLGVWGGVFADRFDRRRLLLVVEGAALVLDLALALLVLTGLVQVWHVLLTAVFSGIAMSFTQPARQAFIADLVDRRRLLNAMALNSVAHNLTRTAGPAVAGVVIAAAGAGYSYLAQAALWGWAFLWTLRIAGGAAHVRSRRGGMWRELLAGFSYVRGQPTIVALLVVALIPTFLAQPYLAMVPVFARDVLEAGPEGLGILFAFSGAGALLGNLAVAGLADPPRKGGLMLGGLSVFGLGLAAFAASGWLLVSGVALSLAGAAQSVYRAMNVGLLTTQATEEMRGRVMSFYLLDRGMGPAGALLMGTLAELGGAPLAVFVTGGSCFLLAGGLLFVSPTIRRLA